MNSPDSLTVQPAPGGIHGRLVVPGDKSISHRALLLAARAAGRSQITGLSSGADVAATERAVQAFGATVTVDGPGRRTVTGSVPAEPDAPVDVGNSGTGIRLLAGWATAVDGLTVLHGDASIARRPMSRVVAPLRLMGASIDGRDGGNLAPLVVRGGRLHGIEYRLPVPSAQVKAAVLLAGLAADGPTTILEEVPTRAHTEEMLAACGVSIDMRPGRVTVQPGRLEPAMFDVPGDPSAAAFWLVAACITPGSDVTVGNVYVGPQRARFVDVLSRMGADIEIDEEPGRPGVADIRARYRPLSATVVSGEEVPGLIDEIPILAVAAAAAEGETVFADASELRVKESDRVATMVAALTALGAEAEGTSDGLIVKGRNGVPLAGGSVDSAGDHRVAMSAAVAALNAAGPVRIDGWAAVSTSYPAFEDDLRSCLTNLR